MLPNPLPECQFHYENGHHCHRIPRRGETFCRDHRRALRTPAAPLGRRLPAPYAGPDPQPAYARESSLPPLGGLGLDALLLDIARSLQALEPLVRGHASDREVRRYQRACTAVGFAMDRVAGLPRLIADAVPSLSPPRLKMLLLLLMYAGPRS